MQIPVSAFQGALQPSACRCHSYQPVPPPQDMLRKFAAQEGKDWDKMLPFLLFAYREVPQESTGFSPFELLYGRYMRGPLDVLKETWVADKRSNQNVLSYVLLMRERMEAMGNCVQENLKATATHQKVWYDWNTHSKLETKS